MPDASTETSPKMAALLMTLRLAGMYSWDGALLLGASFLLFRVLPRTVKPCQRRGPLVYTTCNIPNITYDTVRTLTTLP